MRATLALCAVLCAAPALAADYTLENLSISAAGTVYRAARVEIGGAALAKDEALKLLAADNSAPGSERLARLDAERIVIPELVAEARVGIVAQTTVYRNVTLGRISRGRAATVDAADIAIRIEGADGASAGRIGAIHAEDVDFAAAAQMTLEARRRPDEPRRIATRALTASDIQMDLAQGGRVTIARATAGNFGGRPLMTPLASLAQLAPKSAAEATSPEAGRAAAKMVGDLLQSIELGALEFGDVAVIRPADTKGPAAETRAKRIAFDALADGRIGAIAFEGVESKAESALFRLDRAVISGLDLVTTVEAAATAPSPGVAPRGALPRFDRIEIAGLSVTQETGPLTVERITIEARDWQDLLPASLKARADHVALPLAGAAAARSPLLAALGYDKLDLSGGLASTYDPTKRELAIEDLSAEDKAIGAAAVSARFNHVSPDPFGGNTEKFRQALPALVFWRADLHLADRGVVERVVAAQAKQTGKPPAVVRGELAAGARVSLRNLLAPGASTDARLDKLGDAVAKFIDGAKSLDIRIAAPEGLGAIDLAMAAQLGSLLDRLRIEAEAK